MKLLLAGASAALLAASAARADCQGIETASGEILVAGKTELRWCWQDISGGTGLVSYLAESRTNGADWVEEGETEVPEWTLLRNIGDEVALRYYACDDVACTAYSPESQPVTIYENVDADGNGVIGWADFVALRQLAVPAASFNQLRNVLGTRVVNGVYLDREELLSPPAPDP